MALRIGKRTESGGYLTAAGLASRSADSEDGSSPRAADPESGWNPPGRLGPYLLGELLGQGGMGRVYAATDLVLMREVALKVLWRNDPGTLERFLQEARFQARLDHPNICRIFEVEASGPYPYIAMQRIHGAGLLDTELELDLWPALELMIQCAQAVQAAHDAGMIHRDLKPGNILLEPDGRGGWNPVLLDFGLAREIEGPGLTVGPRVMGTPAYMAPEQAMGKPLSARSDVYSLGATFYALLSGQPPFQAHSGIELLLKQSRETPLPLRALNAGVPAALAVILQTCMAKQPERRYESARALAQDLRRLQAGAPILARAPRRDRRPWLAAAGALALALAAMGGWLANRPQRPPMADMHGNVQHPIRVLLLLARPGGADHSWMDLGLAGAAYTTFSCRSDILPLGPDPAEILPSADLDPSALSSLAGQRGADLVLLTRIRRKGRRLWVTVTTLRPGETQATPVLERSFDPADYLQAEAELRRALPPRLGLADPGDQWLPPRHLETRKAALEAQMLLAGPAAPGRDATALALLRKAISDEPDFPPPRATLARLLNALASEAARQGRPLEGEPTLREARFQAEQAIRLAPQDPLGYQQLSTSLRLAGDLEGSERAALQGLKLEPLGVASHWLLASVENQRPGAEAFQASLDHMHTAIRILPKDPKAHYRLAQLHLDAGQFTQAILASDQAIALDPTLEYAHLVRANALLWSDQGPRAETGLEAALRAHPQSRLLLRDQTYAAYVNHDGPALAQRLERCRERWAPASVTRSFLEGLAEARQGHWSMVRARYRAALAQERAALKDLPYMDRTTHSVDLYFMARVLAGGPERAAAMPFLVLSQELYRNRIRMAQHDPAFRGLLPAHEPWPGG